MTFTSRVAQHFVVIKAARQIRQEIEKAGLDTLQTLAEAGTSIVGTYLNGCSPEKKATYRRDLSALFQMGVTPDMLLAEVAKQLPELGPIMQGRKTYKQSEIKELETFLSSES
ncbi:hypothetical protein ES707_01967 [subsurface metagenome]